MCYCDYNSTENVSVYGTKQRINNEQIINEQTETIPATNI